jgi:hypothetical protein
LRYQVCWQGLQTHGDRVIVVFFAKAVATHGHSASSSKQAILKSCLVGH